MKKRIFILCCFLLGIFFIFIYSYENSAENSYPITNPVSISSQTTENSSALSFEESSTTDSTAVSTPEISYDYAFRNACFYCVETKEMLFNYKNEEKIAPASLAKLLTACVALFYVDPEIEFDVGTELSLVKPHSSLCLIKKGHRLTLNDLITGLLLPSGNDAAYTIAVNVARKVSGENLPDKEAVLFFCRLMNSFAKLIGMKDSNFTSPDG